MRRLSPVLRVVGLVALGVTSLLVLVMLPRVRAGGELVYSTFELEPGVLLEATERLMRGPFAGTVVLILSHREQGTVGVVIEGGLNDWEPMAHPPSPAQTENGASTDGRRVLIEAGVAADRVGWGGPVKPNSFLVLTSRPHGEKDWRWGEICEDLWALDPVDLEQAVAVMDILPEARLLAGLVAWKDEQLVWEILRELWRVVPACSKKPLGKETDRK